MEDKSYVAVARLKEDNSIVRAVEFDTMEAARKYVKKWEEGNPEDSVYFKVEESTYEHYNFWHRTRN